MADPGYCMREQKRIEAELATANKMLAVMRRRKPDQLFPSLSQQIEKLETEWWEYEDLLTAHGEKQP